MTPEKHESTQRLLQSAREGDMQARETLVRENLALVRHLVTVSYTHLDVYKRQAKEGELPPAQPAYQNND